jgi:hypothetical protein
MLRLSVANALRPPLVRIALLAGVFAVRVAPGQAPPASLTRLGSADDYGPGITSVSPQVVELTLLRPAHVIVLRVERDGSMLPVFPTREDDHTQYQVGAHSFEALEPVAVGSTPEARDPVLRTPGAVARVGRRAPPPGEDVAGPVVPPRLYWLVIVSDVPTTAHDVRAQLESMTRAYRTVTAELEALPRVVLGKRAGSWAAYYAPAQP